MRVVVLLSLVEVLNVQVYFCCCVCVFGSLLYLCVYVCADVFAHVDEKHLIPNERRIPRVTTAMWKFESVSLCCCVFVCVCASVRVRVCVCVCVCVCNVNLHFQPSTWLCGAH